MKDLGKNLLKICVTAIENSKKQNLHRLIFGLGIRYVGEATAKTLGKSVENIFELQHFSIEQLQQLKDIGSKVGESIYEFFHNGDNIKMLKTLADIGLNTNGDKIENKTGALSGSNFFIYGYVANFKKKRC